MNETLSTESPSIGDNVVCIHGKFLGKHGTVVYVSTASDERTMVTILFDGFSIGWDIDLHTFHENYRSESE